MQCKGILLQTATWVTGSWLIKKGCNINWSRLQTFCSSLPNKITINTSSGNQKHQGTRPQVGFIYNFYILNCGLFCHEVRGNTQRACKYFVTHYDQYLLIMWELCMFWQMHLDFLQHFGSSYCALHSVRVGVTHSQNYFRCWEHFLLISEWKCGCSSAFSWLRQWDMPDQE